MTSAATQVSANPGTPHIGKPADDIIAHYTLWLRRIQVEDAFGLDDFNTENARPYKETYLEFFRFWRHRFLISHDPIERLLTAWKNQRAAPREHSPLLVAMEPYIHGFLLPVNIASGMTPENYNQPKMHQKERERARAHIYFLLAEVKKDTVYQKNVHCEAEVAGIEAWIESTREGLPEKWAELQAWDVFVRCKIVDLYKLLMEADHVYGMA
jgi:hypothetical protein